MRCGLASLRGACILRDDTGGVIALLLNHRLHSVNPPGSEEGGRIFIPDGMAAISRGLSGATPPERGNGEHDPGRGRSVGV